MSIGGRIFAAVGALIVIIVSIRLLDPLANAVSDVSGLAILGSFGGASALVDLLVIITVAGVMVGAVEILFPGTSARVVRAVTRRGRS